MAEDFENETLDSAEVQNVTTVNRTVFPSFSPADMKILQKLVPIIVPILFTIVIIVGFIGNLLVVLVVITNKTMRNTTNILILNLAIADLLFIVFCVPFTAADYALTSDWPFGDVWCKLVQFLIYVTFFVSIYTLVFMSIDRFLAVVFPVSSISIRTDSHTVRAVVLLWMLVLFTCSPILSAYGLKDSLVPNSTSQACKFLNGEPIPGIEGAVWDHITFQICFFIFGYLLPLLLIIGLYSVMIRRLWRKVPGGKMSGEASRNKKRVVKLITLVITIFAFCWLPIQVILLAKSLEAFKVTILNISIQITSHVLAYANSCVNPVLYAFFSPQFRKAFFALVQRKGSNSRPVEGRHFRTDITAAVTKSHADSVPKEAAGQLLVNERSCIVDRCDEQLELNPGQPIDSKQLSVKYIKSPVQKDLKLISSVCSDTSAKESSSPVEKPIKSKKEEVDQHDRTLHISPETPPEQTADFKNSDVDINNDETEVKNHVAAKQNSLSANQTSARDERSVTSILVEAQQPSLEKQVTNTVVDVAKQSEPVEATKDVRLNGMIKGETPICKYHRQTNLAITKLANGCVEGKDLTEQNSLNILPSKAVKSKMNAKLSNLRHLDLETGGGDIKADRKRKDYVIIFQNDDVKTFDSSYIAVEECVHCI